MRDRATSAVLVALFAFASSALWAPGLARAQVVHAGVDVAALVPSSMEIVDVVVPDRAAVPVRVALAPDGAQDATLLIDVYVGPNARRAAEALAWQIATIAGEVPVAAGLGDRGFADDGYAAFHRDNVMVVIRRTGAMAHDVGALARHIDELIVRSPAGTTRATLRVQLPNVGAMDVGEIARVALPEGALDVLLTASGDVAARRTRGGYVVTRTGPGALRLEHVVVDRRLRTSL